MGTNPKRHHYLPEFYLGGFTRDNYFWLYDREKKEYRKQSPHNTAVIGHYYVFENAKGEKDYSVEKYLSIIEGKAKVVIKKLETRASITPEERLNLAHFVALLMVRTPKFEEEVRQIVDSTTKHLVKHMIPSEEAAAGLLREYQKETGESEITPESLLKFIQNEEFALTTNRDFVIKAMLEKAEKVTLELACMDWLVVHSHESTALITTDQPLGFIIPDEFLKTGEPVAGLASQKVTKIVPLSQKIVLLIGHSGGGFGHANFHRELIRDLNIAIAVECHRYVIGRDEALVRSVVTQSKVDTTNPGTRMKVEHIPHANDPKRTFLVARRVTADAPNKPLKITVKE